MMNHSDNANADSTHNDEGYVEQRFEAPDFMVKWTEEQKAEFAYQLLLSIPTSRSLKVVDRLGPILHRDFFSMLPYELAVYILSHVDLLTLVHMGQVSRRWKIICEDQSLWKQLFLAKGWKCDQQAIATYLGQSTPPPTNKGKTKISKEAKKIKSSIKEPPKSALTTLFTPTTTMSSPSSSRPVSLPLAITNDTLYDPTALPTMPGAPLTSSRLRSLRRPGDIFLRFRQRRPLQNPSPTSNSSSISTPSISPLSPSGQSIDSSPPMLVNESDASAMQQQQQPSIDALMSSSTDPTPLNVLPHGALSLSTSTDPEPTSPSPQIINATENPIIQTPDAASIKRGSKLLLFDTMANQRNHYRQTSTLSASSSHLGPSGSSTPSPYLSTDSSRLPVTTPSLSTVPSPIRRSQPTPSYTRISVSSTLRPTSTPQVGSVTSSALYQRRHHHSTSSSSSLASSQRHRHHHRSSDLPTPHIDPFPPTDPTQHRVIERRRPFKNRPISRQHVNYDETALYHYQEDSDRRFINWRRLYRNRNLIERRWRDGQYWMHMFPLGVTSSPRAAASTTTNDDDNDDDTRHSDWIYCLQFNTQILVSGSRDRTLKIWAMDTGTCLHTLYGHEASVLCLQFDDRWIISGSSDTQMVVWDVTTGKKVWNQATGDCLHTMAGHTELVRTLQMDRPSDRIVSGSYDGSIKIWNMDKGTLIRSLNDKVEGRILNLQFDYAKIVCCTNMSKIFIYDFSYGLDTQFLDTSLPPHPLA
ncbi:hypothetical protein [Absidia glauca]|uniref:F-box domain-containing protein n=1 Tax=Absidia glauca TaxID=4829 RepID=A0A168PED7_ABSGL|nr:hypothetical protein [Absidia glauca]